MKAVYFERIKDIEVLQNGDDLVIQFDHENYPKIKLEIKISDDEVKEMNVLYAKNKHKEKFATNWLKDYSSEIYRYFKEECTETREWFLVKS
ncbi:hypothetical protein ACJ2A9_04120 [Anaerobacillus sp. MEB173]|uniref:hypothetical protein n=1 Tax=Anaerobacillus sp. MEB173 TaxID=3383345 RepID=UPI003F8EC104